MSAKYRLLENLGVFVVQRLETLTYEEETFKSLLLPWCKGKVIEKQVYKTIGIQGYPVGFLNPKKIFKTKEKAIQWISKLNEKYHEVEFYNSKLRPLTDIVKEIEFNGEKFIPNRKMQWLFDDHFDYVGFILRGKLEYSKMQKLIEWGFDITGQNLEIKKYN